MQAYTFFSLLKIAEAQLRPVWNSQSKIYSEYVLCTVFGLSRGAFLSQLNDRVPEPGLSGFFEKINRLSKGEPLAYVLGTTYFCGVEYEIRPGVLIPRPETERIVDIVYDLFNKNGWESGTVLELGFGSGVLSLEIAKKLPNISVFGWDISNVAFEVAMDNLSKFCLNNVQFFHEDFFSDKAVWRQCRNLPIVLVSNPPYIQTNVIKSLDVSVRNFEPYQALCGGEDGLDYYRLFQQYLSFFEAMVFEIGYDLKKPLETIFFDYRDSISFEKDFSGLDRYLIYQSKK